MSNENPPPPQPTFKRALRRLRAILARRGPPAWRKARWLLLRAGVLLGAFLLLLLVMTGFAGWYTSRSEFCNSCHIMEPYYQSWQESAHAQVACIECHFPPGFGGKIRGKVLGLVQLAKYFTKSEGPRPAAEISDASCLRVGCHQQRLLSGEVEFHGIEFDHQPHLSDLRRGKQLHFQLRCTSCHSQIVQGKHMTVTTSTCFLCHFKGGEFNAGLGACTHCHQIPQGKYNLGGDVMFSHDLAYEKGVDYANCHGDVIRGKGEVPRERCLSCHNRKDDLEQIDDHEFMHQKHVTDHKVDCLQCHLRIEHSKDPHKMLHAAADCASCHPDHHRQQVAMLRGIGARTLPAQPSPMLAIRAECRTCHDVPQDSRKGTLMKGSAKVCATCHTTAETETLLAYHDKLRQSLPELEASIPRLRKALESAEVTPERSAAIAKELGDLQHDLTFLSVGDDIHNIHFAGKLNHALASRVSALCRELHIPEPQVTLPPPLKKAQ